MSETPVKESYVKGSLQQVPFPKVLNFINQAGKTGILALSQGKRKVHIHFDRGEIVYVTSSYFPDLSLGDYLVKDGKITLQVQDESIDKSRKSKIKQGAYLVEKGYLSPHDLYEALNKQVMEKLFKLFTWNEGDFFFREGEIVAEEHRILNISFPNLLYRGIRSYLPLKRPPLEFRGRKEARLVKRLTGRYKIEDLRLGPAEMRIYNLINGEHTLRQVIALANMSKRAAYKVVYGLYLLELVGFPEAGKTDEIKIARKKAKEPKDEKASYEISVSNDLIDEAVASIDRIKQEVEEDVDEPAEGLIEMEFERGEALRKAERRSAVSDEDELAAKVNDALSDRQATDEQETYMEAPPDDIDLGDDIGGDMPEADPFADSTEGVGDEQTFAFESGSEHPQDESMDAGEDFALSDDAFAGEDELGGESADEGFFMDIEDYSNPEDLIKQANYLLEEGRWGQARQFLQKALEIDENNADAYALLGWAIFNEGVMDNSAQEAEQTIKQGMKINPNRYLHYLYLGKIYAATEQMEFAELHFVKALELNVECSEAKEEIKRIYNR